MEIFLTEINKNIDFELVQKFQKKEISDTKKLFEHCYAYYAADTILKDFYHMENREIEFTGEKPCLKNRKKYVSLSHSGNFIAICFSDYDCGIDIEKIKTRDWEKISERMNFSGINNLKDFYNAWTLYEASYKLNQNPNKTKMFEYQNYIVTAVSSNKEENFEVYFRIGNKFSKTNI